MQSATQLSDQAREITDQTEQFQTDTTKQPLFETDVVEAAAAAVVREAPETTTVASNVARASVTTTPDPSVVRGDTSTSPVSAFEGLHTASLVAGPDGVKCLAVGLSVLQKVCPPVHGRLKKAVTERCAAREVRYIAVSLKIEIDQNLTVIGVFLRVLPP